MQPALGIELVNAPDLHPSVCPCVTGKTTPLACSIDGKLGAVLATLR